VLAKLDDTLKSQQVAQADQQRGATLESLAKTAAQGATPESLKAGQELLTIRQSLADEKPERLDRRADVAAAQHTIGLIQLSLNQLDAAAKSLAQAEATRQELMTAEPQKLAHRADLAATRLALGDLDWQAGRLSQGATRWREALAMLQAIVQAEPANNRFVSQFAAAQAAVGNAYGEIGLWDEAAGHYAAAFAAQPSGNSYAWVTVGYLSWYTGDHETFRLVCTQALERAKGNIDKRLLSDLTACINLSPEPLIESEKLVAMAKEVLAVEPTAGWRRMRVALAQYRAGQYAEAERSLEGFSVPITGSMVYHRLGQHQLAREQLAKADLATDRVLEQAIRAPSLKLPYYSWSGWVMEQALRREAHALIDGKPLPPDPREHLLRARAYAKLGEQAKSDAEFQAIVDSVKDDPIALLAQVQVLDQLGRHELAEAAFQRVVALKPSDSQLWIERAHQLIAQGDHAGAESAYSKAAEVSPGELHHFLEAGWWVSAAPPEGEAPLGPAVQNVAAAPPADAAQAWRRVPTADWGRVDMQSVPEVKALPTAHVVNYVYSPDLRAVTLLVGSADRVRLELNGELVYDGSGRAWEWGMIRVPVLLRPGRNTFVATIFKPDHFHAFMLRIADSPFDRGYLLAQLGLWDEALTLWTPELEARPPEQPWIWYHYAALLLAQGRIEAYRHVCSQMLQRPVVENWERNRVLAACALAPLEEAEAARLVKLIDKNSQGQIAAADWNLNVKALIDYRAKRYREVVAMLENPGARPDWLQGETYLLRALCQHALGDSAAARAELNKADRWGADLFGPVSAGRPWARAFNKFNGVMDPIGFFLLSREAHQLIAGETPPHERSLAELTAQVRTYLNGSDTLTAAFDRAILVEPDQTQHWLRRYRARTAAGQAEQAERELEQLVRAAPSKPEGWKVRGGLYAALGRHEQAASDFAKALALMPNADVWFGGPRRQLCAQVAQWPDVFDRVQQQFKSDDTLWIGRAYWHAQNSRWREAADDFARTSEADLLYDESCCYAGCRLLAGQVKECRDIGRDFVERVSGFADTNPWCGLYLAKHCTLSADMPAEQSQVLAWAEAGRAVNGSPGLSQLVHGLALYRAGEWERAIPVLNEAIRVWQYGKQPVEKHQAELVLAMCEFRLEQADQSRGRLKTACELIDQTVPYKPDDPFAVNVPNWVTLNILRREAEAMIFRPKREEETKTSSKPK
jgi:tetratricopeptide (TPR) repeat protein